MEAKTEDGNKISVIIQKVFHASLQVIESHENEVEELISSTLQKKLPKRVLNIKNFKRYVGNALPEDTIQEIVGIITQKEFISERETMLDYGYGCLFYTQIETKQNISLDKNLDLQTNFEEEKQSKEETKDGESELNDDDKSMSNYNETSNAKTKATLTCMVEGLKVKEAIKYLFEEGFDVLYEDTIAEEEEGYDASKILQISKWIPEIEYYEKKEYKFLSLKDINSDIASNIKKSVNKALQESQNYPYYKVSKVYIKNVSTIRQLFNKIPDYEEDYAGKVKKLYYCKLDQTDSKEENKNSDLLWKSLEHQTDFEVYFFTKNIDFALEHTSAQYFTKRDEENGKEGKIDIQMGEVIIGKCKDLTDSEITIEDLKTAIQTPSKKESKEKKWSFKTAKENNNYNSVKFEINGTEVWAVFEESSIIQYYKVKVKEVEPEKPQEVEEEQEAEEPQEVEKEQVEEEYIEGEQIEAEGEGEGEGIEQQEEEEQQDQKENNQDKDQQENNN